MMVCLLFLTGGLAKGGCMPGLGLFDWSQGLEILVDGSCWNMLNGLSLSKVSCRPFPHYCHCSWIKKSLIPKTFSVSVLFFFSNMAFDARVSFMEQVSSKMRTVPKWHGQKWMCGWKIQGRQKLGVTVLLHTPSGFIVMI